MTKDELQKVVQAIEPLDRFAFATHLDGQWHNNWRQFYAQAVRQLVSMVDEPAKKPEKAKPGKPSPD